MGSGSPSKFHSINKIESNSSNKKQLSFSKRILNLNNEKLENEKLLRLRILDDIQINFHKITIIMLFSPPEFPIDDIAQFISKKVQLPVIKILNNNNTVNNSTINLLNEKKIRSENNEDENNNNNDNNNNNSDNDNNNNQQNNFHIRMELNEKNMLKYLEERLLQSDCENGCILLNFPQTPKQYSFLCQLNTFEHLPIFFEIDSQVIMFFILL